MDFWRVLQVHSERGAEINDGESKNVKALNQLVNVDVGFGSFRTNFKRRLNMVFKLLPLRSLSPSRESCLRSSVLEPAAQTLSGTTDPAIPSRNAAFLGSPSALDSKCKSNSYMRKQLAIASN